MIKDCQLYSGLIPDGISSHSVEFFQEQYEEPASWKIYGVQYPSTLKTACLKRKVEFLAGRYCSMKSLEKHGFTDKDFQLVAHENRAPIWPESYIGSISHSDGFAVSIVSNRKPLRGMGIDVESNIKETSLDSVRNYICLKSEQDRFANLYSKIVSESVYCTLIFSAKESIYKALNPIVRKFFGFQEAEIVEIDFTRCEFSFQLKSDLSPEFKNGFCGKGSFHQGTRRVISFLVI